MKSDALRYVPQFNEIRQEFFMNQDKKYVPLIWNVDGSDLKSPRGGFLRPAILAVFILSALAAVPAPRAAETQLNIRITPRGAALIAALQRGMTPAIASASMPAPGSNLIFAQSCNAAGGSAIIVRGAGFDQLVCA